MIYKIMNDVQIRISNVNKINTEFKVLNNGQLMLDNSFLEAILISSPSLFSSIKQFDKLNKKSKVKVIMSLSNYSKRLISRATPYGLFAAVGLGTKQDKLVNNNFADQQYKKVRPTMNWLLKIKEKIELNPDVIKRIKFKWNDLILSSERLFLLMDKENLSIKNSSLLKKIKVITKHYVNATTIISSLQKFNSKLSKNEILKFIEELVKSEILVTSLEPLNNNSIEYFNYLIKINTKYHVFDNKKLLIIQKKLIKYESLPLGTGIDELTNILKLMKQIVFVSNPIFVDLFLKNKKQIDEKYYQSAKEVNEFIEKTACRSENTILIKQYMKKFVEKYGLNIAVPIKKVFNPSDRLGNPFESLNTVIDQEEGEIELKRIIKEKILQDIHDNNLCSDLTKWVENGEQNNSVNKTLPFGYDLFTTPLKLSDKYTLVVNPNTGCNSPKNVWGRFNYEFSEQEKSKNEVEVYSLPYNKKLLDLENKSDICSSNSLIIGFNNEKECGLCFKDIALCVSENCKNNLQFSFIDLRSKKNISFRVMSMINYRRQDLFSPILRFLLEVSYFNKVNNFWLLNFINNLDYPRIPRFTYKHVILTPAQWRVNNTIIANADNEKEQIKKLKQYLKNWDCPDKVYFLKNDIKRKVNISNKDDLKFLIKYLEKENKIILVENLSFKNNVPIEYVFSFKQINNNEPIMAYMPYVDSNYRKLPPNNHTHWLYYELYVNQMLFKDVIRDIIFPLVIKLKNDADIDNFFYIYYLDPSPQLRVRFHVNNIKKYDLVRNLIENVFLKAVIDKYISKYSLNTYEREIDRYGGNKLLLRIEKIFGLDSVKCIQNINCDSSQYEKNILSVCELLSYLGFNNFEEIKNELSYFNSKSNQSLYKNEAKKAVRKIIYTKEYNDFKQALQLIIRKKYKLIDLNLYNSSGKFIGRSIIHLHFNRLLFTRKDELKNEFIAYKLIDALCKKEKYYGGQ